MVEKENVFEIEMCVCGHKLSLFTRSDMKVSQLSPLSPQDTPPVSLHIGLLTKSHATTKVEAGPWIQLQIRLQL